MNRDAHLIFEAYAANKNKLLNEVDWERFADVEKTCLTADAVASALNNELERLRIPSKDRPKANLNFPRISKGNIPTDEEGKANIVQFISDISQRPNTIFDEGEKSKHSTDEGIQTINTGIPALRAVLWDEQKKEFYIINTCPGAGECPGTCYAMKGFYIMQDGKNIKLIRRLQMMMNHPDLYEKLAYNEAERFAFASKQENKLLRLRWNDAGDLYSKVYFDIVVNVTNRLLESGYSVESYAYTKVGKYMKLGDENGIIMNFSSGAKKSERDLVQSGTTKYSEVVPKRLFTGIFIPSGSGYLKDELGKTIFKDLVNGREELKKRIFDEYKDNKKEKVTDLTYDSLKYTDELPKEQGNPLEYNMIVLPGGDSDVGAQRKDVRTSFLLFH